MEDFLEIALKRQSCRSFVKKSVEHDKLVKCVEAGRLAPSACNSQPWKFVVVENPELVEKVAKCGQPTKNNAFLDNAGAFIIVLEQHAVLMPTIRPILDSQYFAKADLGATTVQICLEASTLGLSSCIIGIYDRENLAKLLGLPVETRFASFIAIGYPSDTTIRPKIRKPLEDIVEFI